MSKQIARNLTLALTLLTLAPAVLATPTGGDPEPMSAGVVQVILTFLHLS